LKLKFNPFTQETPLNEEEKNVSTAPLKEAPIRQEGAPVTKLKVDPFKKQEPVAGGTYVSNKGILSSKNKINSIRNYMMHRKGDYYRDLSDEELLDDFVDHMRWVESNEVSTLGEARQVFDLKDEEKFLYSDAYGIYDEMGNAYQAGGWGEVADAASHYVGATALAPSTWIGGFIGRGAASAGAKAFSKVGRKGITEAVEEGAKAVAKGAPVEKVLDEGFKEGVKKTAGLLEKTFARNAGAVSAKKSRQEMVAAAIIGATTDGSIGAMTDIVRQDTRIHVGAQEERDYKQTAMNAAFGLIGGGVAYLPDALRGTVKLTDADQKIDVANKLRAKTAKKEAGKKIEQSVKRLAADWEEAAKKGQAADVDKFLRDRSVKWFFDIEDENSLIRILHSVGADLGKDKQGISHKMLEFAKGMAPKQKEAINEALKPFNITFGQMMDIFAGSMKEGGENLSQASQAARFINDFRNISVAKGKAVDATLAGEDELAKNLKNTTKRTKEEPGPEVLRYVTSVWKRLLVSSIPTTMLNIKGWGWATGARTMSEILHGGVLGSVGLTKKMMGMESADKTLAKSAAMFKSNGLLLRSLLDPYTSVKGFKDLLEHAPEKYKKESLATFFGGIGDERPEMFNVNPYNKGVKAIEKTTDMAARLALVRTQDIYTKAFTGLKELDKLSRIELGMGVEDLLKQGKTHLITTDMWDKTVKTLLEDTFSVNYTRGHGAWNKLAHTMETISNTPYAGFIFPFGRFINNTVSFAYQYSPLAFLPITKYTKGIDLEERLAKAVVGTSALAMVTMREEEKQKEGLQWNEERTSTGDIKDVGGVYPLSLYNLTGRIISNIKNGGGVPKELGLEFAKQVGPLGALRDTTTGNPIIEIVRELFKASENDNGTSFQEVATLVGGVLAESVADIAAGFTRPLDAANDVVGMMGDIEGVIDDRQLDRKLARGSDAVLQNFGRYTNTFFNYLLGEDTGDGKLFGSPKNSATERDPMKDPNPLSRTVGAPLKPRQDSIDILLGMVDMPTYKADSFTTGVPEYDDFLNNTVFRILERKAQAMLDNEFFRERPLSVKRVMVADMLKEARNDIISGLENGSLGEQEDRLFNLRRKFIASNPQSYRAEAKKYFGITAEDRELTSDDLYRLQAWIDINKSLDETLVKNK